MERAKSLSRMIPAGRTPTLTRKSVCMTRTVMLPSTQPIVPRTPYGCVGSRAKATSIGTSGVVVYWGVTTYWYRLGYRLLCLRRKNDTAVYGARDHPSEQVHSRNSWEQTLPPQANTVGGKSGVQAWVCIYLKCAVRV